MNSATTSSRSTGAAPPVVSHRSIALNWAALVLGALTFAPRLLTLQDPPWVNDEGTYAATALAMRHGELLYQQVWENKPPLIYILNWALIDVGGPSHILIAVRLCSLISAVLVMAMLATGSRALALSAAARTITVVLCGLLLNLPFLEGTTANAEIFMIVFTSGAALQLIRTVARPSGRPWAWLGIGASLGVATLWKAPAAVELALPAIYVLRPLAGADCWPAQGWKAAAGRLALLLAGYAAPLVGVGLAAASAGDLGPMLQDAVLYALGYVGHSNGGQGAPWLLLIKAAGAVLLLAAVVWRRPRQSLLLTWLILSTFGSILSGRTFNHYFLQLVPAASLVVGATIGDALARRFGDRRSTRQAANGAAAAMALVALAVIAVSLIPPSSSAAPSGYFRASVLRLIGAESPRAFASRVDTRVARNEDVASWLDAHTAGGQPVFVWGNAPWVYVLADRPDPVAYTSIWHTPPIPGEAMALRQLLTSANTPIVMLPPANPTFPWLTPLLAAGYHRGPTIDGVLLYLPGPG